VVGKKFQNSSPRDKENSGISKREENYWQKICKAKALSFNAHKYDQNRSISPCISPPPGDFFLAKTPVFGEAKHTTASA